MLFWKPLLFNISSWVTTCAWREIRRKGNKFRWSRRKTTLIMDGWWLWHRRLAIGDWCGERNKRMLIFFFFTFPIYFIPLWKISWLSVIILLGVTQAMWCGGHTEFFFSSGITLYVLLASRHQIDNHHSINQALVRNTT